MTTTPVLTWVIVLFGGIEPAARLVRSLGTDVPIEVVLCANGPGDTESASRAFADDLRVRVLPFEDNPGYLRALHRALPSIDTSRPVVLSNFDLDAQPGVLRELVAGVAAYPDAGVLAPSVIGDDGADQNPNLLRPPSRRWLQALAAVHRFPVVADLVLRGTGRRSRTIPGVADGAAVFAGHGSCCLLTPAFFAAGGSTDYPFPLFGEELWLGEQCQRLGLTVRYLPAARLHHDSHVATGNRRSGWVARVQYDGLRWWARRAAELGW